MTQIWYVHYLKTEVKKNLHNFFKSGPNCNFLDRRSGKMRILIFTLLQNVKIKKYCHGSLGETDIYHDPTYAPCQKFKIEMGLLWVVRC